MDELIRRPSRLRPAAYRTTHAQALPRMSCRTQAKLVAVSGLLKGSPKNAQSAPDMTQALCEEGDKGGGEIPQAALPDSLPQPHACSRGGGNATPSDDLAPTPTPAPMHVCATCPCTETGSALVDSVSGAKSGGQLQWHPDMAPPKAQERSESRQQGLLEIRSKSAAQGSESGVTWCRARFFVEEADV